jgi:hypothetical protein
MGDEEGLILARVVYSELLKSETIDLNDVPYVLDTAVQMLRSRKTKPYGWAPFVHIGA